MEIKVMKALTEALESGKEAALVTITEACGSTPGRKGNIMVVFDDGSQMGTTGGGNLELTLNKKALQALKDGKDVEVEIDTKGIGMKCGGDIKAFIKVFKRTPRVLIVGGGHIGYEVYTLARYLRWDTVVVDDRVEFASEERFPKATELYAGDIGKILDGITTDDETYIVIATRGHLGDMEALKAVLRKDCAYIGMIGSRKKVYETMEKLKGDGFEEAELERVYAPIGLDIASREPKEIALGIMAEILMVKNGGTGKPLKSFSRS